MAEAVLDAPKKRGRKPKVLSEAQKESVKVPIPENQNLENLKDLTLSQQLVINRLVRRLDYMEMSFKNLADLSKVHGGSFAKFQFLPPKE